MSVDGPKLLAVPMTDKEYVDHNAMRCPRCGWEEGVQHIGRAHIEGTESGENIWCHSCETGWVEFFHMKGYAFDDEALQKLKPPEPPEMPGIADPDCLIYVLEEGQHCPFCKSVGVRMTELGFDVDGPRMKRLKGCQDCGASWFETWGMTGFEALRVPRSTFDEVTETREER